MVSSPDGKRGRFTDTEQKRVRSLLALVVHVFEANAVRTDRRNFRYGALAGSDDGADSDSFRSLLMDLAFEIGYLCGMYCVR